MTLNDAENQIARILKALENETGALVEQIELHAIDITNLSNIHDASVPHHQMQVRIVICRKPAHGWGQA